MVRWRIKRRHRLVEGAIGRGQEENDVSQARFSCFFLGLNSSWSYSQQSTYDEYLTELDSGLLRWSPPHTSEEFWSQNADKLNEKNHQQLKLVVLALCARYDHRPLIWWRDECFFTNQKGDWAPFKRVRSRCIGSCSKRFVAICQAQWYRQKVQTSFLVSPFFATY